jgi:hypothetical protein
MRRDPRPARALGLWTAAWLFVLLLGGLLWVGNLPVQWPVLVVPALWALVALRPRGPRATGASQPPRATGSRTDTVERPALRPRDERNDWH